MIKDFITTVVAVIIGAYILNWMGYIHTGGSIVVEGPSFRNRRTNLQGDTGVYGGRGIDWGYTGKGKANYAYAGPAKGPVMI